MKAKYQKKFIFRINYLSLEYRINALACTVYILDQFWRIDHPVFRIIESGVTSCWSWVTLISDQFSPCLVNWYNDHLQLPTTSQPLQHSHKNTETLSRRQHFIKYFQEPWHLLPPQFIQSNALMRVKHGEVVDAINFRQCDTLSSTDAKPSLSDKSQQQGAWLETRICSWRM